MDRLKIATLLYHEVCDDPRDSGFQRRGALPYKHTCAKFDSDMTGIARVAFPALVSSIDFSSRQKHILLTFDDGGKSAIYVADRLSKLGWKAHFFVTTSRIGQPQFMSAADIRYVRDSGHLIGSHSHTHPDIFRDLSRTRMAEEWRVSREIIEQLLGSPCPSASVPGGDISTPVLHSMIVAGFRYIFTSEPHLFPRAMDGAWILGRVSIKNNTPSSRVEDFAAFRFWQRERALRSARVLATTLLPPLYRWYVRSTVAEGSDAL